MGGFDLDTTAEEEFGVMPRAVRDIFARIAALKSTSGSDPEPSSTPNATPDSDSSTTTSVECSIHVSYIELYNEELHDLLEPSKLPKARTTYSHTVLPHRSCLNLNPSNTVVFSYASSATCVTLLAEGAPPA